MAILGLHNALTLKKQNYFCYDRCIGEVESNDQSQEVEENTIQKVRIHANSQKSYLLQKLAVYATQSSISENIDETVSNYIQILR